MSFVTVLSCSASQKEIRAYIEPNPHWKIIEVCGYEHCDPMIDILKGKDVAFRVEFDRGNDGEFFIIQTIFTSVNNQFEFNPSNVMVKFKNEEILKPKGFTCSRTIWDLQYLRSNTSLRGPIPIKEGDCFVLFFDRPIPQVQVEEELVMNLGEALLENDRSIGVPLIHFRKSVGKQW
jgi:hypothetical protein